MNRRAFLLLSYLATLSLYAKDRDLIDLKILNFDDYFADNTIKNFELRSGKNVRVDTYGSDSEAIAKFLRSNPRYDLVFISDINVERFIRLGGLLSPIDKTLIPNLSNIDDSFLISSFDPKRIYSIPYFWGTLGIGYRKSAFSQEPTSFKYLFDSDRYSGRIALLADGATNIQMALKYLGYSLNSSNIRELEEAKELLKKQRKHIAYFAADNGQDLLESGEVDIVLEWNGDMLQLMDKSDEFGFVVPNEGTLLWEDCMVIPQRCANAKLAHSFIDYIYQEQTGVELAEYLQYATPNRVVKESMPISYRENRAIYPPEDILKRCEKIRYNGAKIKAWYDKAWSEIV